MVLWKKESTSPDAHYIDLLAGSAPATLFLNQFLKMTLQSSKKDDAKSTESRMHANQQFGAKNCRAAMELYNQTLRYAPEGSENISLAYANRSACFLHMKMYDECLVDIELARAANYPQRLMHKLDERQAKCMELMAKSVQHTEIKEAALSYAPNEQFPSLANVLDIRSNDEFGEHIVAKQDIEAGQIVLVEEAFVHKSNRDDHTLCKTCLKYATNFIPCRSCNDCMFCGDECMESNTVHKRMCGISWRPIGDIQLMESVLLAAIAIPNADRLMEFVESALASRDLDSPKCDTEAQAKYRMFLKLFALSKELDKAFKLKITLAYEKLLEYPDIKRSFQSMQSQRFLMHLIWQHLCIIQTNGIALEVADIYYDAWQNVSMVANFFSLFNHSCYPHAMHLRQGNKMVICTLRPIKSGEQVFINYLETPNAPELLQDGLRETFQFECQCSKCVPSLKQEDRMRIQRDPILWFINQTYEFIKENRIQDFERSVLKGKVLAFLNEHGRLPWSQEIEKAMKIAEHLLAPEYSDLSKIIATN